MAVAWPSGVPTRAVPGGVQVQAADQLAAFEADVGPPITRPRSTMALDAYRVTFAVWSASQYTTFRNWLSNDLAGGGLEFALDDPITGVAAIWQIDGPPEIQKASIKTYVSVSLVMLRLRDA